MANADQTTCQCKVASDPQLRGGVEYCEECGKPIDWGRCADQSGWNGRPLMDAPNGSWHLISDPEGNTYRMRWEFGQWYPDTPWVEGGWDGKEIEPHELAALGGWRYVGPSPL